MYSQLNITNVTKTWKVFIVMLSVIFGYQILPTITSSAFASAPIDAASSTNDAIIQTASVSVTPPLYKKANFLDIIDTHERVHYSKMDFFCMAKNIYHEAGHEPILGRYAVAQVTLNRMKEGDYPKSVCGVVFQNKQFSWANLHSRRWTTPSGPAWEESKRIAHEVLDGGKRIYGLDDALFYHATYVRPGWARTKDRVARIGLHIFYDT